MEMGLDRTFAKGPCVGAGVKAVQARRRPAAQLRKAHG